MVKKKMDKSNGINRNRIILMSLITAVVLLIVVLSLQIRQLAKDDNSEVISPMVSKTPTPYIAEEISKDTPGTIESEQENTQSEMLSDSEVISMIFNRVNSSMDITPIEIKGGKNFAYSEQFRVDHMTNEGADAEFMATHGYQENELSKETLNAILMQINLYSNSPSQKSADVMSEGFVSNTDFRIKAEYDNYYLQIYADDNYIYVRTKLNDEYYMIKLYSTDVYNMVLRAVGAEKIGFDFNDILDVKSISIIYIEDKHLKNYPENGKLTEYIITDRQTIEDIVNTLTTYAAPVRTYPSRENADLIMHTINGDIYFKIKNPFELNNQQKEWVFTEPTVIAEGYYWYNCAELYSILFGFVY